MNSLPWRLEGATLTLYCHVQPGARQNRLVGLHDQRIKIQLKAPPVDGKANAMLLQFLAGLCACPRSAIDIKQGHGSRKKTIQINNISEIPEAIYRLAR